MTQDDLVELSRLFTLWLAALPGESPVREVAEEIDKLIAHRCGDVPAHVANGQALLINDYAASPLQARPPSLVAKRAA